MADKINSADINSKIPAYLYQEVRKDIVSRFLKYDSVEAIYEFGKTKNVGISDLDLALVLSNTTKNDHDLQQELSRVYQQKNYQTVLCGGTIMIFSKDDFANVHYLDDIEPNLLAGNPVTFNSPTEFEYDLILICQILDWLPERLLSLRSAVLQKNMSISLLGYLYSICYTFKKISDFTATGTLERHQYVSSVESLRSRWFDLSYLSRQKELSSLIEDVFVIGFNNLRYVVNQLVLTNKYRPLTLDVRCASFSLSPLKEYLSSHEESYGFLSDHHGNIHKAQITVPNLWFHLWSLYGRQKGPISKELIKQLHIEPYEVLDLESSFSTDLTLLLIKRFQLCNSMASFLKRCGFSKGLYKFGWFFR